MAERAIRAAPEAFPEIHHTRAEILKAMERWADAREAIQTGIGLLDKSIDRAKGEPKAAKRLERLEAQRADYRLELASVLVELGDKAGARRIYEDIRDHRLGTPAAETAAQELLRLKE